MRRIVLVVLAVALAAAAVVVGVRAAASPLEAGPNRLVNVEKPIDAHNSPTLAANPRQPDNVALTYRVDRPAFSAVLEWSTDGGKSWKPTALPLPQGIDRPFAPDVAFGPDGTLYVTYVNLVGDGNVPDNLWLARSTDGGRSLSAPVRVAGRYTFGARLAVGPDGTIHVTWLQADEVGFLRLAGDPAPIVATRSTDGGRTFSAPVPVSDPSRTRVATPSPVIDSRGDLVVLYQDFKEDRRDFEFLEGPPWDEPFALVLTRSTDGGQTFSPGTEVDAGVLPDKRILVFLAEFPAIAAGPDDRLYVSWADARNGDEDVFLRTSSDGGVTWSEVTRVNDNPTGDGTSQYMPRVAVAPSGRIDVLYLDRRDDPDDVMTETSLAQSTDGGRTFDHVTVSSEAFDSTVGPFVEARLPIDFGSRIALLSSNDETLAAWTDSRYGDEGTGRQDILAAQVAERRSGPLAWVLVATLGLLAVLAAIGALESGRRGGRRGKLGGDGPGAGPATTESAGPRATVT
ncbi:MAG: glycoside hydrolase [Actinomycetota bacterium]|nr:glycoside hydrolase [Actinomycetota bacterium]